MAYNQQDHFLLEKELADELRKSSAAERKVLYQKLYTKLFSTFPEIATNLDSSEGDRTEWQIKLIKHLFDKNKIFLEIGAGDCLLSKRLAPHFKKIVAYEVASTIPFIKDKPDNLEIRIFNGVDMSEAEKSVDIIYSNQVFEHLHVDDIAPLLSAYHSFLRDKGKLVVITPHRLTGPHDISRYFTDDAQGFHMMEYTYKDMKTVLKAGGFKNIKGYVGYSKWGYIGVNVNLLILAEKLYGVFPKSFRKKIRGNSLIFNFFGLKIIASKA
jgi:2-polyprenyl-3-methyl-5-hydroxy-6-metoxy-1,4-benzoquinol methylase